MKQKISSILKEVLEKIEPPEEDLKVINNALKDFLEKTEKKIKSLKITAEVFIGGSFAKDTVIKKDYYDIDAFIRFDKKYNDDEISKLTGKILKELDTQPSRSERGCIPKKGTRTSHEAPNQVGLKENIQKNIFTGGNVSVVHGSRDYFRIKISPDFFIEVIPVIKVKNPKESRNITDLSYSHVKYLKKKIGKTKELANQIKLAKVFCYANNCYGAESYINGFSGYALELLICKYKSFMKFITAMSKLKEKEVIDLEKHYKSKQQVLMDVNSSKLKSPIILIDPTYKQRNALAALSDETFEKFQKTCKKFLKNPSVKSFEIKKVDLEKIKQDARKKKYEFILLETKTEKQEGDVAGTKLLKFYNHLDEEIKRYFEVKDNGFNYNGKKSARYFFVVKKKKDILIEGPSIKDKTNLARFKKKHRNNFNKKGRVWAKEVIKFSIEKFIENWNLKNKRKMKEMQVKGLKVVKA
jgi:tRNA nucleotidyltransferase (CCA-adding enzyme)